MGVRKISEEEEQKSGAKSKIVSKKLKPESPQLESAQEGSKRVQAGVTTAKSETPTRRKAKLGAKS